MKAFIRATELGDPNPQLIAVYDDTTSIKDDAHGPDMVVVYVPASAILQPNPESGRIMPCLTTDWRAQSEAAAMSIPQRIDALHDLNTFTLTYGADVSKWPQAAKTRKAEIDQKWK